MRYLSFKRVGPNYVNKIQKQSSVNNNTISNKIQYKSKTYYNNKKHKIIMKFFDEFKVGFNVWWDEHIIT